MMVGDHKSALYFRGLPDGIDVGAFQRVISEYGTIKECKMVGTSVAYVNFAVAAEAEWVVKNLDGNIPEGLDHAVQVSYASGGPAGGGAAPAAQTNMAATQARFEPYGGKGAGGMP